MKNKIFQSIAATTLSFAAITSAEAALIDRGNGMIYDSTQNITWLADANYAATQYAASGGTEGDADGRMYGGSALSWAAGLSYGGYDDWRLAQTDDSQSAFNTGYNHLQNEIGHLFYVDLGLTAGQSILSSTSSNLSLFDNLVNGIYWMGSGVQVYGGLWTFDTSNGYESNATAHLNHFYAWAVRDGDVASAITSPSGAVPEPSALALIFAGMLGLASTTVRRRKTGTA